jgi:hypothetical protein
MSEYLLLAGSAFLGISTATLIAVRSGQALLTEAKTQLVDVSPARWFENEVQVGHVSESWLAGNEYTRGKSGDSE